ncbi:MAG: glycosyltransferase, partial [Lachnospiraceae bacterium]|nr:glycosyltransferase [Lachnospiraceae bacterium]
MKKIAVVILNWNGRKMLEQFRPSVIAYSQEEAEVIVADNASTDDSLQLLQERFPEVRVIVLDQNYGFADGYNQAFQQVEAEYFVLLNSDVKVVPHWLSPLVMFMDSHPDVAACQPKLLSFYDEDSFEYAGASGGYLDRLGYPFCRGRVFDTVEKDNGQYDDATDVLWATGACLMVRAKDYWEAGALDGRFFAHN